jgi:putative ABC transport system ATP-binding protein
MIQHSSSPSDPVVQLHAVRKTFGDENSGVVALGGVTLDFLRGSFTAIMGPSGSGKSTLLHCAAGLDRPSSGSVMLEGQELQGFKEVALTKLRRQKIGFVFQAFNLLPALTVLQNVVLPLQLAGKKPDKALVREVIARVGLGERQSHRPGELSGGQQQRVAIARALVMQPAVIFADEPTGALDTHTSLEILTLMREAVEQSNQTIIMVTHDPIAASHADHVIFLADGQIVDELDKPTPKAITAKMSDLYIAAGQHKKQAAVQEVA